jgi:hypothetical protein
MAKNPTKDKYSSIPRTGLRYPKVIHTPPGTQSYYDPHEETIYAAAGEDPSVMQHEMFHHWQNLNRDLQVGPVRNVPITAKNPGEYYNRRQADIQDASNKFLKKNPSFVNIPFNLLYNKEVEPSMYYYPEYAEGEAEEYENYVQRGGQSVFPEYAKGGPVYNWIPPNYPRVGARNEQGGWLEKYANGGKVGKYARKGETYNEKRATELGYTPDAIGHLPSVDYETSNWLKSAQHPTAWKEHLYGYLLNPAVSTGYNLGFDFGGYFGKNQLKYYPKKEDGGDTNDSVRESTNVVLPVKQTLVNPNNPVEVANSLLKQYNVKVDSTGNILKDIGLPSAAYYNPITRTINYKNPNYLNVSPEENKELQVMRYIGMVADELPHAIQADSLGVLPFLGKIAYEGIKDPTNERYRTKGTLEHHAHKILQPTLANKVYNYTPFSSMIQKMKESAVNKKANGSTIEDQRIPTPTTPSYYPDYPDRTLTNYQMGTPKVPMYAAGSTVWTKQTTPTWVAGTPTPTATQNFRNDRSLNTDRYRIGDVVPTGMDYKSPAAGTYDYSKDIQPYHTMRLHAPSTTKMARNGGQVTEEYKKRAGIPYAINPGITDAGMYVGPTTQRGITFGNGGDVPPLYVSNPNDPGLKLYNDSLALFKSYGTAMNKLKKDLKAEGRSLKHIDIIPFKTSPYVDDYKDDKILPIGFSRDTEAVDFPEYIWSTPIYKKPVQPIIYQPKPDTPTPDTSTRPTYSKVPLMPMRGMPSVNTEKAVPQKVTVPKTNLLPPQYMDTRGEWSSTPQVPPGYTPEQLLKMGYRAPQKKANGGWLDSYEEGGEVDLNKPYLNPATVQTVLAKANQPVTTTTGRVISTPASREKERREKVIAKNPSKYSVEDYKQGIKEPGADNSVLSDPIAMAAALTAGGVGLGAYGLTQVPRMFASNLASEATAGLTDVRKLFTKRLPFKSEIDWAKWNKELPENKALMQEYNAIEKRTKADGTWMKYNDGTPFTGTPEQFVQMKSKNVRNFAGGSNQAEELYKNPIYRGTQVFDPSLGSSLRGDAEDYILFGTDNSSVAERYATNVGWNLNAEYQDLGKRVPFFHPDKSIINKYTGLKKDTNPGVFQFAVKTTQPKLISEGMKNRWFNVENSDVLNWLKRKNLEDYNLSRQLREDAIPDKVKTDDIASYMIEKKIPVGEVNNVFDGVDYFGNPTLSKKVTMINPQLAVIKSLMYNNGMFDVTNPNIYKSLIPGAIGLKALQESLQQPEKKAQGGPIYNWVPNYPRVGVKQYNKKQSGGWLDNL